MHNLSSMNAFMKGAAMLLTCCMFLSCSDSSSPTDPNDSEVGNGSKETITQTITGTGGTITLSNGARVVFPDGIVSTPTEYTVSEVDPATYFDGSDVSRTVIFCSGAVEEFDDEVEIMIPLPDGMTEADSSLVFTGVIDEESGAVITEPSSIRMIEGKPYIIIATNHFSGRLAEWLFGKTPPSSYTSLTVPYYNQGSSNYCWATSVQMVIEAAKHSDINDITDIIGSMGVDEGGITSFSFRYSPTLTGIIMAKTGVRPDRKSWGKLTINRMKDYLKSEIGIRKHPVALFNGAWEHAVVVVGYDGDTFYIHDPQSVNTSAIGYTAKTWNQIFGNMGVLTNMVTLSIPLDLDSSRPEVTTHIMPGAFDFIRPKQNSGDQSKYYRYSWDYTKKDGYSFKEGAVTTTDPLPAEVTELKQAGDVEVYNSSRTSSKTVSVWLDISAIGAPAGEGHYSANEQLTVGPNSLGNVVFDTIPVSEFRWGTSGNTEYLLSVKVLDGGTLADRSAITFTIPPAPLHIDSLTPESGPSGTEVTIKGTGFGTSASQYNVFFGVGSSLELTGEVISWKDTEIVVKVPDKASTGNVEIREKGFMSDVKSNGVLFTVSDALTISGKTSKATVWGDDGTFATFTADWSFTGAYTITDEVIADYATDLYFNVKLDTNASLTVTMESSLVMNGRTTISLWDSTRIEESFHDLKLVDPVVTDPEESNSSIRTNGSFPYSASNEDNTISVDYNLKDNYVHNIELLPVFEYIVDTRRYSIKVADYGRLISSDIGKQRFLYPVPITFRMGVNTRWMYWPDK